MNFSKNWMIRLGATSLLAAAATCLALTPVLPAGLPVLVALVAVPIGLRSPARPGHRRAG